MKRPTGLPVLKGGEYAVVFAEGLTGVVLSTKGSRAIGEEERFRVFVSLEMVTDFVLRTIAEWPTREGVVIDSDGNTVAVHRDDDALVRATAPKQLVPWWKGLLA